MYNYASMFIFPFSKVPVCAKLVIWGKGGVGKSYYQQLIGSGYAKDILIVDSFSIINFEDFLNSVSEHYIIIAILAKDIRNEIANKILELGFNKEQLIYEKPKMVGHPVFNINQNITVGFDKIDCLMKKELRIFHSQLKIKCTRTGYVRIGNGNDGGYVMVDNLNGGIAYSFGINRDVSWDKDMSDCGYDVYMYDHTIDSLPYNNDKFHFFKYKKKLT